MIKKVKRKKYTEKDREKVIYMHSFQHLTDNEIVEKTGFNISYVSKVTREYWEEKRFS